MITDDQLNTIAITFGLVSVSLIVVYQFVESNFASDKE
ncbi:unnamed protein product [Kuraishia capsulata CBS 1993]|uniref:Uncharacterized protein n=1 Tax=Kuraishia capsulata CBS 1993 TaxID=1382522 RepID=W6MQU0_9ASCO|nr:uncharacterized protein KUCA_T00005091001 [Kuraishia capsulata CBS 1993]CDK29104.1 unnamed protein product [Kuraishia capsulata CBS 1993]